MKLGSNLDMGSTMAASLRSRAGPKSRTKRQADGEDDEVNVESRQKRKRASRLGRMPMAAVGDGGWNGREVT